MNKLFGLFLLVLASLPSDLAQAANRFATCTTTCTWDNTSTAMWGTVSGGTGASAPVAGDAVIFDTATCVGGTTCTITTFAGTISAASITWGTCTASTTGCIIDASANNTNFTLSGTSDSFSGTGTGTRKWLGGTGTYAITNTGANRCLNMAITTSDQGSVFSGATWSCSGTTAVNNARTWDGGSLSYGPTTFNANTGRAALALNGVNTFASLTVNGPELINLGGNQTITGALTLTGVSNSQPIQFQSNTIATTRTISIGSASTGTWVALRDITTSGAAGLTVSNCIDLGNNTLANGGVCNTPAGGAGGGRIIGG